MSFRTSSNFPFAIGGVVTALAIAGGASGVLTNYAAGSVAMPGILLLLDASVGTRVLSFYFFATHPFTYQRVQELYFARSASFGRYGVAVILSVVFAGMVASVQSEVAIAAGLVGCVVLYGLLTGVGLVRCILQAKREGRSAAAPHA